MKAQSDLAGDRKRTAEMTVPRTCVVTNRDAISKNISTFAEFMTTDPNNVFNRAHNAIEAALISMPESISEVIILLPPTVTL